MSLRTVFNNNATTVLISAVFSDDEISDIKKLVFLITNYTTFSFVVMGVTACASLTGFILYFFRPKLPRRPTQR